MRVRLLSHEAVRANLIARRLRRVIAFRWERGSCTDHVVYEW